MAHTKARTDLLDILFNVLLILAAVIMVFPFFWLVTTSLKLPQHVLLPDLWPKQITLMNYEGVFKKINILLYFFNTLRFAAVSTVFIISTSSLAGYVFAKYRFPYKEVLFLIMISTMMIPFESYMVPLYLMMVKIRAVDTYFGLQLPYLIQSLGTFFMRQNFESFPDEYLEAGRIEGASETTLFLRIALPNVKSAIGGLSIFVFSAEWGNLIWPLIITSSKRNFVMELGLTAFQHQYSVEYGQFAAAATLAVIPVVVFFVVFRTRIMEGITLSGIK